MQIMYPSINWISRNFNMFIFDDFELFDKKTL